jgi:hypothetical protein
MAWTATKTTRQKTTPPKLAARNILLASAGITDGNMQSKPPRGNTLFSVPRAGVLCRARPDFRFFAVGGRFSFFTVLIIFQVQSGAIWCNPLQFRAMSCSPAAVNCTFFRQGCARLPHAAGPQIRAPPASLIPASHFDFHGAN